jgi:uncharacterized protein (DUF1330 family)
MSAYLISLCRNVTDRKRLEDYWANVAPAFKSVTAKPLVAYLRSKSLKAAAACGELCCLSFLQWRTHSGGTTARPTRT